MHVCLDDDEQFFDFGLAERFNAALGCLQQGVLARQHLSVMRNLLRACDVRDDLKTLASLRHALKSENFNRHRRASFRDRLPAIIEHRTHLAKNLSDDERIVNAQSALLNENGGDRAAPAIKFSFEHDAGSEPRRAGLEIENVCGEQDRLKQGV